MPESDDCNAGWHELRTREKHSRQLLMSEKPKSETRMTASFLKEDPNTQKIQNAVY